MRLRYLSIVQMYKIIFGYCDTDSSKFYDNVGPSRTTSTRLDPKQPIPTILNIRFLTVILVYKPLKTSAKNLEQMELY